MEPDQRAHNQDFLVAFDHIVRRTLGVNINNAMATLRPARDLRDHVRLFLPDGVVEDSEGAMQPARRGARIEQIGTGEGWTECPRCQGELTIHTLPDQGHKCWRAYIWLYIGLGVRGWVLNDCGTLARALASRHAVNDVHE